MERRMLVSIGKKTWTMSRKEYEKLLEVAKEQVSFGIYAVERGNQAYLRNEHCESMSQLKKLTREYKAQGFKVRANGR